MPTVFDVRAGLTPAAIESLQCAARVQVEVRDPRTGVLGLWTADRAEEMATVLIVRAFWLGPIAGEPRGPLDMLGPTRGGPWEQIATELRAGDLLTIVDRDRRGAGLRRDVPDGTGEYYKLTVAAGRWRPESRSG